MSRRGHRSAPTWATGLVPSAAAGWGHMIVGVGIQRLCQLAQDRPGVGIFHQASTAKRPSCSCLRGDVRGRLWRRGLGDLRHGGEPLTRLTVSCTCFAVTFPAGAVSTASCQTSRCCSGGKLVSGRAWASFTGTFPNWRHVRFDHDSGVDQPIGMRATKSERWLEIVFKGLYVAPRYKRCSRMTASACPTSTKVLMPLVNDRS